MWDARQIISALAANAATAALAVVEHPARLIVRQGTALEETPAPALQTVSAHRVRLLVVILVT